MLRKFLLLILIFNLTACAELQQVVNQLPQGGVLSNADIASGLRQALDLGIDKQVSKLTQKDGFFKNELVKILLPDDLKKIDKALRDIGLSKLADDGLKILNRAAEDAVNEATPIFVSAVKDITFADAKNILLGNNDAATQYLTGKTETALYDKFHPVIKNSFGKVGADQIWEDLINRYNALSDRRHVYNLVVRNNMNPDMDLRGYYLKISNHTLAENLMVAMEAKSYELIAEKVARDTAEIERR